jgi:hypothetical protein
MAKLGRPSKYTKALADKICERIALGDSLDKVCQKDGFPHYKTVLRWLREDKYKGFRSDYARAREDQADWYADRIRDLAERMEDETTHVGVEGKKGAVDAYKWLAAKRKANVYGDSSKLEHTGAGGTPLQIVIERAGGADGE